MERIDGGGLGTWCRSVQKAKALCLDPQHAVREMPADLVAPPMRWLDERRRPGVEPPRPGVHPDDEVVGVSRVSGQAWGRRNARGRAWCGPARGNRG
jgi:hypothetical protein